MNNKTQLVAQGAEAILYSDTHNGQRVMVKERVPKEYRHSQLDMRIRKTRMRQEITLLVHARNSGVRTPVICWIDVSKVAFAMELIAGPTLRTYLTPSRHACCVQLGKLIGKLHAAEIIAGDLTTSNVLVRAKKLVLIDFGLGFRSAKTEDRAVDLLNLKKTFLATHSDIPNGFEKVCAGYRESFSDATAVLAQLERIEARARYS